MIFKKFNNHSVYIRVKNFTFPSIKKATSVPDPKRLLVC